MGFVFTDMLTSWRTDKLTCLTNSRLAGSGRKADECAQDAASDVEVLSHGIVELLLVDLKSPYRLGSPRRFPVGVAGQQRQSAHHLSGGQFSRLLPVADERHPAFQDDEHRVRALVLTEEQLARIATDLARDRGHASQAFGADALKNGRLLQDVHLLDRREHSSLFNFSRSVIGQESLTRRTQRKTDGEHRATASRSFPLLSVFSVLKPQAISWRSGSGNSV